MTQRFLSSVRRQGDRGVVRVEDVYDTSAEDLWSAITEPARLAAWIAVVEGDLRVGGVVHTRFTSSWEADCRIVTCEPPRLLRIVTVGDDSGVLEARITPDGTRVRLTVEDHGLPIDDAPDHAAGWQVHLEDLRAALGGEVPGDWRTRWTELREPYRSRPSA